MKLPARFRKLDILSIEVDVELFLGGICAVILLRWLM